MLRTTNTFSDGTRPRPVATSACVWLGAMTTDASAKVIRSAASSPRWNIPRLPYLAL